MKKMAYLVKESGVYKTSSKSENALGVVIEGTVFGFAIMGMSSPSGDNYESLLGTAEDWKKLNQRRAKVMTDKAGCYPYEDKIFVKGNKTRYGVMELSDGTVHDYTGREAVNFRPVMKLSPKGELLTMRGKKLNRYQEVDILHCISRKG